MTEIPKGKYMKHLTAIFALACCASISTVQATPIIYDFSVTATSGNLAGFSATGSFGFDDTVIPAGTNNSATGLLSFLDFTWNGIAYTPSTANTGAIWRLADGTLSFAMFGTNCFPSVCSVSAASEGWNFRTGSLNDFSYSDGQTIGFGTATARLRAQVPEPASLALLGLGLGLMGYARQRRAS